MILEELVEKLATRLLTLEKQLKNNGLLADEALDPGEEEIKQQLPEELGERMRTLNDAEVLRRLREKTDKEVE